MRNGSFDKICINIIQNKGNYMISNLDIIYCCFLYEFAIKKYKQRKNHIQNMSCYTS